jgi:glycosyltransferase involved in cell wall biosynthesis
MRIGLDVAQTCFERHGCGWVADRIATAIGFACPNDEVILYHQFGEWLNWSTSQGTVIGLPNVSAPFMGSSWWDARIAWKRIESGRVNLPGEPEVVHSFSFQAPVVGNARLVYTIYDFSFWTHPEFTTEDNRLNCQRGMLDAMHSADALVFISENSRRDFHTILPKVQRLQKLPSIVLPLASRFPTLQEARASFHPGPWLSIGALEPRKNFDLLLDAYEIYRRESKIKRQLVLAGGKGWKSEGTWNRIKELQRIGAVKHRGYVPDSELQGLYQQAFCLVFPSHYEGFGLPVLEAMSQGCPVISAGNSSLPEVGAGAICYWDGESAATLAGAMLQLERNEENYLRQSKEGLERAGLFSWERTALELRKFYDQVLGD